MIPAIDLQHESDFAWTQWLLLALLLVGALFYIWRKLFAKKGCGACSGCGKSAACHRLGAAPEE